jgi:Xaa-Pro aminopeptidase
MGIGPKPHYNDSALQAGHVISNEPGYYADGKFGIRIEDVMGVKLAETRNNFGNKGYLEFEHFTMVRLALMQFDRMYAHWLQAPIQTKLVDFSLLSPKERQWLNDYNQEVEEKVLPLLQRLGDERAVAWLKKECEPVELTR